MLCPFCNSDPYDYADVGVGYIPIAVTCCEYGVRLYSDGEQYQQVEERFMRQEGHEPPLIDIHFLSVPEGDIEW